MKITFGKKYLFAILWKSYETKMYIVLTQREIKKTPREPSRTGPGVKRIGMQQR